MNFDDLRDQLLESLRTTWDKIEDSSLYITLKERYDNLSSFGQKASIFGVLGIILLAILLYPIEAIISSTDYTNEFETKRELVRKINSVTREVQQGPSISPPPPATSIISQVQRQLSMARLLPEQIVSVMQKPVSGNLIPKNLAQSAVLVRLSQLNIRQVLDIGRSLEGIHDSAKLKDMSLAASKKEGYYDVSFEIVPLDVPTPATAAAAEDGEEPKRPKAGGGRG